MKETWRWFGPDDTVKLAHVHKAGATGIVSDEVEFRNRNEQLGVASDPPAEEPRTLKQLEDGLG